MRKDVKAGIGLALVAVIFAGWYYTRGDGSAEKPIALAPATADKTPTPAASRKPPAQTPRKTTAPAERRGTTAPAQRATTAPPSTPVPAPAATPTPAPVVAPVVATALTGQPEPVTSLGGDADDERDDVLTAPGATAPAPVLPATGVSGAAANTLEPIEFYRIQPGDTLWRLAEVYYGNRSFADLILRANPDIRDADTLRAGLEIRLPAVPAGGTEARVASPPAAATPTAAAATPTTAAPGAATTAAAADGSRTYVVRTGDSFFAIAQRELGSGGRWQEVFGLNRELVGNDPKALRPGMKLRLPAK